MVELDPKDEERKRLERVHRMMDRLPWIVVFCVIIAVLLILLEVFLR